jgi:hypothetical protein
MGLDITAYSHLKHVGEYRTHGDECEEEFDHTVAFAYDGFQRSVRGLVGMEKQGIVGTNFVGGDCYEPTTQTESAGFRAGSYSGYGAWRDDLARIAGFSDAGDYWGDGPAGEDAPFYELINFADNEGTIGPEAAKDLLEDFRAFRDKAVAYWSDGRPESHTQWDIERYDEWTEACELAAADGLICFH